MGLHLPGVLAGRQVRSCPLEPEDRDRHLRERIQGMPVTSDQTAPKDGPAIGGAISISCTPTPANIAWVIWEAHRAYQMVLNDYLPAPPWQTLTAPLEYRKQMVIKMVRLIQEGATPREVHQEWCDAMTGAGWEYGEEKDPLAQTHPCLVDWDDLPQEARDKVMIAFGIVNAFR